jgi:hypothetical protein
VIAKSRALARPTLPVILEIYSSRDRGHGTEPDLTAAGTVESLEQRDYSVDPVEHPIRSEVGLFEFAYQDLGVSLKFVSRLNATLYAVHQPNV